MWEDWRGLPDPLVRTEVETSPKHLKFAKREMRGMLACDLHRLDLSPARTRFFGPLLRSYVEITMSPRKKGIAKGNRLFKELASNWRHFNYRILRATWTMVFESNS